MAVLGLGRIRGSLSYGTWIVWFGWFFWLDGWFVFLGDVYVFEEPVGFLCGVTGVFSSISREVNLRV